MTFLSCSANCEVEFNYDCLDGTLCVDAKPPDFEIRNITEDYLVTVLFSETVEDPLNGSLARLTSSELTKELLDLKINVRGVDLHFDYDVVSGYADDDGQFNAFQIQLSSLDAILLGDEKLELKIKQPANLSDLNKNLFREEMHEHSLPPKLYILDGTKSSFFTHFST